MLYSLIKYLVGEFPIPGSAMFLSLTFRAVSAIILALLVGIIFGKYIIRQLQRHQIGEEIRNLGLEGQLQKRGTPTMGGLIILTSILVPILLVGDLTNIYVQIMLFSTVWLGLIGFLDDYIKVFRKRKEGLKGKFKIFGQVGLGIIVGLTMWFHGDIVVKDTVKGKPAQSIVLTDSVSVSNASSEVLSYRKTTETTIPFFKNNEFEYDSLVWFVENEQTREMLGWLIYVAVVIFAITLMSNSANLTDGLDGLAVGVASPIGVVLAIFAYLSGNAIFSSYLNIMYLPGSGELLVYGACFVGALLGFLWYNGYPAQVFMGDTGSLAIGGIIAVFAIL
ncbi:MAG: phospho-N-acetylmuramoyl-pentapeptide-transferase, partial [Rikenellaceae bacterium]|nr:phospho-N-acetylmuramoyl-pentapeptide-transferase [Rikenellaceae bacterium]